MEYLRTYAATYVGNNSREDQDDQMLAIILENSLTEDAFLCIQADKTAFMVNGDISGIMMMKHILSESSVDSSIDPEVLRVQLSKADQKFLELDENVKVFNDWVKLIVNQLRQRGTASTDLLAHLFTAYLSSSNDEFRDYIIRQRDQMRDGTGPPLTYQLLMRRANDKMDAIEKDRAIFPIRR